VDPALNNQPVAVLDVSKPPGNASGGAGGLATAGDYLRFAQMLANGGQLDGARILSPAAVRLMTSDHIAGLAQPLPPGMLLFGSPGYGFGFGMMVRLADGGAWCRATRASSCGRATAAPTSGWTRRRSWPPCT
jgi:CubicO group peptidase (beta-lactamase class C family)